MYLVWIVCGLAALVLTFTDTFFAVLNYDEDGIFVNRFVRRVWAGMRFYTRRAPREWRPLLLRQVTGVIILTTILTWLAGMILGFALIYLGLIQANVLQVSPQIAPDIIAALYLSIGQFSTLGVDYSSPDGRGHWVFLIPALEALTSVVFLTMTIAFLTNVYSTIQALRSLCADFFSLGPAVGDAVDSLVPYFTDGQPRELEAHLAELVHDFNAYCDSLMQDHPSYLFQSGDDQFSLPFALHMTSGVAAAVRWGLPSGHQSTKSPSLPRLIEAFDSFRELRYRRMHWPSPCVPDPVDEDEFTASFRMFHEQVPHSKLKTDPWVLRFLTLNARMAILTDADPYDDAAEAYGRYTQWLAFATSAQWFTARVARDLDFQPVYRADATAIDDPSTAPSASLSSPAPSWAPDTGSEASVSGLRAWLYRRQLFIDPGLVRLDTALRTLLTVTLAGVGGALVGHTIGSHLPSAVAFAGLMALFSMPMTYGWGGGLRRAAGLIPLVPALLGIACAVVLPRGMVIPAIALGLAAALAVWIGRFGGPWVLYGQLFFIGFYFSLLLDVTAREIGGATAAAAVGIVCAWGVTLLPPPSLKRQLVGGLTQLRERVELVVSLALDALTYDDEQIREKRLSQELTAVKNTIAAIAGMLPWEADDSYSAIPRLRSEVFAVQVAVEAVIRELPSDTDRTITVLQRSMLSGELAAISAALRSSVPVPELRQTDTVPADWPVSARVAHEAILELASAARVLHVDAIAEAISAVSAAASATGPEPVVLSPRRPSDAQAAQANTRRAVQAALSSGLAVYFGSFFSTAHQYWAAMPAHQTIMGWTGLTMRKSLERIFATIIGATLGFQLALAVEHDPIQTYVFIAVAVFMMAFSRAVASSWSALWQSLLIALSYDLLGKLNIESVDSRILETAIGVVLAALISFLVLPVRPRRQLMRGISGCVDAISSLTSVALQGLTSASDDLAAIESRLTEAEQRLNKALDEFTARADATTFTAGAQGRHGIQSQRMPIAALAAGARALTTDARAVALDATASGPTAAAQADLLELSEATDVNFQATLAVLAAQSPERILDVQSLPAALRLSGDTRGEVLLHINQNLLSLISSVQPGQTEATGLSRTDSRSLKDQLLARLPHGIHGSTGPAPREVPAEDDPGPRHASSDNPGN